MHQPAVAKVMKPVIEEAAGTPQREETQALLQARRRQFRGALALLAGVTLLLTFVFAAATRGIVETEARGRTQLYARVLEDQLTRALTATANMQRALALRGTLRRSAEEPEPAERLLEQQLAGQPYLRGLAIADDRGLVLVSTDGREVGLQIDLDRIGRRRDQLDRDLIGPLLPIRGLGDLGQPTAESQSTALPMIRAVPMEGDAAPLWLVTLINPEFFANQYTLLTADSEVRALVADLQGEVVTSTAGRAPLHRLGGDLPLFQRLATTVEHDTYVGAGSDGAAAVAAYRLSRQWPLLVLAELPMSAVETEWRQRVGAAAAVCAAVLALLAALGWFADRGLRREMLRAGEAARLQAELADTEQRWKLALEGAGHGVWDLDLQGGQSSLSPSLRERLAGPGDEQAWTAPRLRALLHPDDEDAFVEALERHLRGELPRLDHEARLRDAAGGWFWAQVSARKVTTGDGETLRSRLIGTVTDIDARKTAEIALRASEARQQAILRSALDGIVSIDVDGHIVDFNPAAEAIFGHPAAAVIGQPMHEVIMPRQHHAAHAAGMARYRATGHGPILNRRIEVEALRANGEVFPIEMAITPVVTGQGLIFTATVRDIGERRRIERALRESQDLLDKVSRIGAIGGWQVDLATQRLRWTEQTFRLHDLEPGEAPPLEEAIGYYAPESQPLIQAAVQRAAEHGESFDLELRMITARGRSIWVRSQGGVESEDGRPVRVVGTAQDITIRRDAEAALEAARRRELSVGSRIQQSLLMPRPDAAIERLWLSALNQPSQGVDGDFFELVPLGKDTVDLIVGDVMGKGVAAALLGAATKMQFSRSLAQLMARPGRGGALPAPAEIVAEVHRAMTPHLQALDAFVTLSYVRLDTRHGRIVWVGCGNEEPLLLRHDGGAQVLENQHPPLGILDHAGDEQGETAMAPGDALFLASDGAADARRPDGSRVGREHIHSVMARLFAEAGTPAAMIHALRRQLLGAGAVIDDDLTLAMVVAVGDPATAQRRELGRGLDDVPEVRRAVEAAALAAGLADTEAGLFTLACVEAYTNAVRHGRGALPGAPVELVLRQRRDALVVEIVSVGDPFEPPAPPAEIALEDYPEGGFGLTIIDSASDRVEYLQHLGVNTVRLTRELGLRLH